MADHHSCLVDRSHGGIRNYLQPFVPQLLESLPGEPLRKPRQDSGTCLKQEDARIAGIDAAVLAPQRKARQLSECSCQLHAGRATANQHEGKKSTDGRRLGLHFCSFEGMEDSVPNASRVSHALEAECKARPVMVAEIVVLRAGGNNQVIVVKLPIAHNNGSRLQVKPGNFGHQDFGVALPAQQKPNGGRNLVGGKAARRDLI